jgi:hypothetical protein
MLPIGGGRTRRNFELHPNPTLAHATFSLAFESRIIFTIIFLFEHPPLIMKVIFGE